MLPNTAGSSEQSVTGTPWFMTAASGCIGIDVVSRWSKSSVRPMVTPRRRKIARGFRFCAIASQRPRPRVRMGELRAYEMGQTSTAMFRSRQSCMSLGCLINEKLRMVC